MVKRKLSIFLGVAVLITVLASFSIRGKFMTNEQYRSYVESEKEYVQAMTDDKYGGKTSQETLDLFLVSLKEGDVELASKYFMLSPDLSRDNWVRTLTIFKDQGLLDEIISDIEKNPGLVELKLNEYSGVWKIVNFK